MMFNDAECAAKIMEASSNREMKNIASSISGFRQIMWEERAFDITFQGFKEKFRQHPNGADFLLKTGSVRYNFFFFFFKLLLHPSVSW